MIRTLIVDDERHARGVLTRLIEKEDQFQIVAQASNGKEALEKMEPLDREAVALRHFEELTSPEIAQVLGISESGARKRYLRGMEKLGKIL